jgi:hypothetical protein
MPSSDRQPLTEPELTWLLHSALAWALTGALMMMARRPLWSAVGGVLTVLGLGVVWMVRRRPRQQPPRQQTNGIFPHRSNRPGHRGPPGAVKEGAMSVFQPDPESGQPTASEQR